MEIRYLSFFLIAWASLVWAQENPSAMAVGQNFTVRTVDKMVVFPGCEAKEDNKQELQRCMSVKLSELLIDELGEKTEEFAALGQNKINLKVSFVISKEGKIVDLNYFKSDDLIVNFVSKEVVTAMENIAQKIDKISAAELSDGTKVNLFFTLPVNFNFSSDDNAPPPPVEEEVSLPYTEMTISTLIGERERYEVRFHKPKDKIRVYEISSGKAIFLGTFNHPYEMAQIEPYKSLIEKMDNRNLVVEYKDQNQIYRIYTHNDVAGKIFVYQVKKGKEVLIDELDRNAFLKNEKYLKWVLHD